jgi:hypothetical protein
MQSVPITTNVSSNPAHGEVYSIQHYVIKFVSDLQQVGGFLWVLRFPPRYNWNIVESGIKLHKTKPIKLIYLKYQWLFNKVVDWSFIDEHLIRQTMRYFNCQIRFKIWKILYSIWYIYGIFVWRSNLTGACLPWMILNVVECHT